MPIDQIPHQSEPMPTIFIDFSIFPPSMQKAQMDYMEMLANQTFQST